MDGVLTVGQVAQYLKVVLETDVLLRDVWVTGEVSNLSHSAQGHTYFTLKDLDGQLRCVIFRQSGGRQGALLRQGIGALVHGRVGVYEAQGSCQLYVDLVQPEGVGRLHRRLEELKVRLLAEGLFDAARKRPLPLYPRRIGVVTSAQAAALQDILSVLADRFPSVEVVLAPTLVQGDAAAAQIVQAIQALNAEATVDVIIVARGGGSIEELWPFNAEEVARAIVASAIPIISGVGHESDTTVADLAADLRAPTPTAAAVAAVPNGHDVLAQVRGLRAELQELLESRLTAAHDAVGGARRTLAYSSPLAAARRDAQRVATLRADLDRATAGALTLRRASLAGLTHELGALSPLAHFKRGYAVVTDAATGALISTPAAARPGQRLHIRMHDGALEAVVLKLHDPGQPTFPRPTDDEPGQATAF